LKLSRLVNYPVKTMVVDLKELRRLENDCFCR